VPFDNLTLGLPVSLLRRIHHLQAAVRKGYARLQIRLGLHWLSPFFLSDIGQLSDGLSPPELPAFKFVFVFIGFSHLALLTCPLSRPRHPSGRPSNSS
jgi:hypothetical protein